MKIDDLPRYIEAPEGGMWKIISSFEISDSENVFVRLDDVKKLLEENKTCQNALA